MTQVTIVIDSIALTDTYARCHGKAVDEKLNKDFWDTQPDKVVGVTSGKYHHEEIIDLGLGRHTVEYGVSAWEGEWRATITANEKVLAAGVLTIDKHLTGSFFLGALGFLFPIRTPMLKINLLTFPPLRGGRPLRASPLIPRLLPKSKPSHTRCLMTVNLRLPTDEPARYATVDLFRVKKIWRWEYDVFVVRKMTDGYGNTSFEISPGTRYHLRYSHYGRRGDSWTTPEYCGYHVAAWFPS